MDHKITGHWCAMAEIQVFEWGGSVPYFSDKKKILNVNNIYVKTLSKPGANESK